MQKTNVMRILEQNRIMYEAREYSVDENDLSGISVAKKIGINADAVFKTIVLKGDKKGYCVFCLPVAWEIDLKKAAKLTGDKSLSPLAVKELLPITGYIRGGVSPIGMKKMFPVCFEETAVLHEEISISAGCRGCQLIVNPNAVITLLKASLADFAEVV
ncbi:MAG: Cys-tRNA(Pro) deacylase [Clostridia bacterium]|nr:Cys-tRNA(Pro) deacylase [Clostridia bacterium]